MIDEETLEFDVLGRYAGFVTRLVAFVVDRVITALIIVVTVSAVQFALNAFRINQLFGFGDILWQVATGFRALLSLLVIISYDLVFWILAGQTPGKRLMGVRVVRTDGQRLRIGNAIVRRMAYVLSGILFLGFIWILFDKRRQGLHDKLAGTLVVYSWPEEDLKGTFVRDQVQRTLRDRQMAQEAEGNA
jgi:uncharacterized RDD family membrane protein YckC